MYFAPVGIKEVALVLDGLKAKGGQRPHLVFPYDDSRLDWSAFGRCTNRGYPGLDLGQRGDCRWSLPGGRGLHATGTQTEWSSTSTGKTP
jgi:hypothetical protein